MDKSTLLHLSLIDGVGPAVVNIIVNSVPQGNALSDVYQLNMVDFVNQMGLSAKQAQTVATGLRNYALVERELQLIESNHIQWVTCYDAEYPALLKEIYLPPTILYWQGALSVDAKTLAIVGSRKANAYGKRVIEQVTPELVAHGFTIVSGGALGADSMAHETTLWCGGKTVAVIGSGLLKPYPRPNKKLFEKIVENGGSIVSSFALHCDALPGNFPARNRIISGLSQGCIVVQAAQQSGAKITAQCALEQGRQVFAVPGPIDDELSWGCHELISQGATLINDVYDIIEELPAYVVDSIPAGEPRESSVQGRQPRNIKKVCDPDPATAAILQACQQPVSTDDLLIISGLELPVLTSLLFQLQLDGRITQTMMGLWQQV